MNLLRCPASASALLTMLHEKGLIFECILRNLHCRLKIHMANLNYIQVDPEGVGQNID